LIFKFYQQVDQSLIVLPHGTTPAIVYYPLVSSMLRLITVLTTNLRHEVLVELAEFFMNSPSSTTVLFVFSLHARRSDPADSPPEAIAGSKRSFSDTVYR